MKIISVLGFLVILFTNVLIASPGDSVGMTAWDIQANGGCEKRIYVDDLLQVHVIWTKIPFPFSSMFQRRIEYNMRFADGTWLGEQDATPYTTGYGSLDMTRIPPQRVIISFYYYNYPCIDIAGDIYYAPYNNWLWPIVTCANNDNIVMVTDDNGSSFHHVVVTTDYGNTWSNPFSTDSTPCISQYVISTNYPGSNKVVFVETRFITDSAALGQLDNNIWFRLSADGGVTWGPHTNVTHYQPSDSVRAFCNVSALFDSNDKLHIVWAGRRVQNGNYYDASKIFHWDEVHNQITVVSQSTGIFDGGWWGWTNPHWYGAWRMPADQPQMTVDYSTGVLYCFWCGQNDTTDYSLAGWPNGDIYGAQSTDGGLTWGMWTNLTNTHTPGALPGECEDEDYITVNPFVVNDSIYLSYIEDKDAGAITQTEGDTTNNIVRVWIFHKNLLNIQESNTAKPPAYTFKLNPNPTRSCTEVQYFLSAAGMVNIRLYGVDGRLIRTIEQGNKPAGSHRVQVDTRALAGGTYFVVLETPGKRISEKIVVLK